MSTRSRIGILRKNGSIDSIFCHFDGYLDGVGEKLISYYNDLSSANKLINRGDIETLHEYADSDSFKIKKYGDGKITHSFFDDDATNWDNYKPIHSKNIDELLKKDIENLVQYIYLFNEQKDKWIWSNVNFDGEFRDLEKTFEITEKLEVKKDV